MRDQCLQCAIEPIWDREYKQIQDHIAQSYAFDDSCGVFIWFKSKITIQADEECVDDNSKLEAQHRHYLRKTQDESVPELGA